LNSQNERLSEAVAGFKKFLEYDPQTKIKIIANADDRSSEEANMALSERRARIVKDALIALGVDEARIEMEAKGETQLLDKAAVKGLEEANGMRRPLTKALVHAYNRRADLVMIPTEKPEQQSRQVFPPRGSRESNVLESSAVKGFRTVEKMSVPVGAAPAAGQQ
ncbi:MAG TPA: OmpA family protein, partial [Candidatus Limnocylindrales bacterium]|nr:OmpA family protein [Candidatus Limnocylindrales bacterium]